MNKDKVSSQEIIDLVSVELKTSKRSVEDFLKLMFSTIEEALIAGEMVKIKGFGTFKLHWNAPRKSVNVQTGQEFVIDGYYKVNFIPEAGLKDKVNEPFAHLEPVEIDATAAKEVKQGNEKNEEEELDSLNLFDEQATEIKDILSEINSMSSSEDKEDIVENKSVKEQEPEDRPKEVSSETSEMSKEEPKEKVVVKDKKDKDKKGKKEKNEKKDKKDKKGKKKEKEKNNVEEISEEPEEIDEETSQSVDEKVSEEIEEKPIAEEVQPEPVVEEKHEEAEPVAPEILSTPEAFTTRVVTYKGRRRGWIWVLIVVVLLGGIVTTYVLSPPTRHWFKNTVLSGQARSGFISFENNVKGWFTPTPKVVPQPKVTKAPVVVADTIKVKKDTVKKVQKVDSLAYLFNHPRVYKKYVARVRMRIGWRLTILSERYYGKRDFWVYIYEANKDHIKNPDVIPYGTIIKIPKVNPLLIDKNNPRCIEYAKKLHDLYLGKK